MSDQQGDLQNVSVLVIEDEFHTRRLIVEMLKRLGVGLIFQAADGGAGLEDTVKLQPSLVICDIHMEPVSGLDYLTQLRQHDNPGLRRTPVLFVTVERNPKTVMAAKWLSVDGYLVKPISLKDLNIRIRAALARRNRG